ncbi:MAG TPA: helix-turn-helix domain-containing protein [Amycolatopsis sp.]|nr:helix-turn-helix domain-containing protein [Amycolatopsis sp.]
MSDNFVAFWFASTTDDFRGALDVHDLGNGVTLTKVDATPSRVLRTPRLVRHDWCDDCLFLMHVHGNGLVRQEGQQILMPSGYGSIHLANHPYELAFDTASQEVVLQVPRRILSHGELVTTEQLRTGVLPTDPAMRVYSAFVTELSSVSEDLTEDSRYEMGQTAVDLLTSVLRRGGSERGRSLGSDALLRSMQAFARANIDDPELTPEALAAEHNVSLRYVQQLFATAGTSPAAFIRVERLECAKRILADPRQAGKPITAVAFRVGFNDVNTFIRAFRKHFDMTPGAWRSSLASARLPPRCS